nr:hypothetical protein [Tanacetum cinerariifolium]
MKMEILLEPTSNKLMVDGGEGTWFQLSHRFITTCSYPTIKYKDIVFQDFRYSDTELTLQLVYDVLRPTPFYKAFLVTTDVPEIYMQEFWATATVHHHSIPVINKCLSGKSTGYDSLWLSQSQILWEIYHKKNINFAYLMWEDFVYQVEHKDTKKRNEMYYPRFTKVIIHFFMTKDPSILRRNKDLLKFGSLFGFDHRLKTLEANFSEFVQTNQFAGAVSSILGIVERYIDQQMNEAVKADDQDDNDDDQDTDNDSDDFVHPNLGMNVGGEEGHDAEDDDEELYRDVNINLEEFIGVILICYKHVQPKS